MTRGEKERVRQRMSEREDKKTVFRLCKTRSRMNEKRVLQQLLPPAEFGTRI